MLATSHAKPPRGRPREFDADVAVARAMDVFWTKGYRGTSLPDLLDATRLSRGSLYSAFGDKHALFLLGLDRYIADSLSRVDTELDPKRSALAGIRLFLEGYVARNHGAAGRRGCLIVATAMEMTGDSPEIEQRVRSFFAALESRLAQALQRARDEGELAEGILPANAARLVLGMVEGLRVMAKTGIDKRAWQGTVNDLLAMLASKKG
jgi:TetR/AcrR family transcriptional regulator, transcriptional repressor for nem operon